MYHRVLKFLTVGWLTIGIAFAAPTKYQVKVLNPAPNAEFKVGDKIAIEATLSPKPPKSVRLFMTAVFSADREVIDRVPLYDDGEPDHHDLQAGDGIYSNSYTPRLAQDLTLQVRAYWDKKENWSSSVPILVKPVLLPTPTPTFQPTPTKPTKPLGGVLTIVSLLMLIATLFTLRRTLRPQGGLSVELRFIGRREALVVGPKGSGDITIPQERFADLKLAKVRWDGLNSLVVQPVQAKSAWIEETRGQRLREGSNRIKVTQIFQNVPVSGEAIVTVSPFVDENRVAIGLGLLGAILLLVGVVLLSL